MTGCWRGLRAVGKQLLHHPVRLDESLRVGMRAVLGSIWVEWAMHSIASCARYSMRLGKLAGLVATSGRSRGIGQIDQRRFGRRQGVAMARNFGI